MSTESRGFTPTPKRETENTELVNRAEELATKFQKMLERNSGKYPPTGMDALHRRPSGEDEEVMGELADFFEDECRHIPSVEIGTGGTYDRNELKKVADNLWLLRDVRAEYDVDVKEYSIVDKDRAKELLQASIEEKCRQIQELESEKQKAEKLLSEIR